MLQPAADLIACDSRTDDLADNESDLRSGLGWLTMSVQDQARRTHPTTRSGGKAKLRGTVQPRRPRQH
jgi:hypothetical protein